LKKNTSDGVIGAVSGAQQVTKSKLQQQTLSSPDKKETNKSNVSTKIETEIKVSSVIDNFNNFKALDFIPKGNNNEIKTVENSSGGLKSLLDSIPNNDNEKTDNKKNNKKKFVDYEPEKIIPKNLKDYLNSDIVLTNPLIQNPSNKKTDKK
jgi:hypothetical protein